jgi:hypothetical protein
MKTKLLLQLADYLEAGNLLHEQFDFSMIDYGPFQEKTGCGTAGCAIGELPGCFSQDWVFYLNGPRASPILKGTEESFTIKGHLYVTQTEIFNQVSEYFGISTRMAEHLFLPYGQYEHFKQLEDEATAKQVARNIRKTVKLELSGNKKHREIVAMYELPEEEEEVS